jgi:hypothetical protein
LTWAIDVVDGVEFAAEAWAIFMMTSDVLMPSILKRSEAVTPEV